MAPRVDPPPAALASAGLSLPHPSTADIGDVSAFQFHWPPPDEHLYCWAPGLVPLVGVAPRRRLEHPGSNACRRVAIQNAGLLSLRGRGPAVPVPTTSAMSEDADRRSGPLDRGEAPGWRFKATDVCVVDCDVAEIAMLLPESCILCAVAVRRDSGLPPPATTALASLCRTIPALFPALQACGGLPRPGTILRFTGLEILRCPTTLVPLEGGPLAPTCDLVLAGATVPAGEGISIGDQVSGLDTAILRALRGVASSGRPSVVIGGLDPDTVGLPPLYIASRLRAALQHPSVRGYFRSVTLACDGSAPGPDDRGLGMFASVLCAMCTADCERPSNADRDGPVDE